MDLVAEMLLEYLPAAAGETMEFARIQPPLRRRFSRADFKEIPGRSGGGRRRFNLDRGLNRFWDYPRALRARRGEFDLFHVVDHAYAQLVHALPPERTVVTCHDLHTFQCLMDEGRVRRSLAFRWMTRRVLSGLEKAGSIVVDTAVVGEALVARNIVPGERVQVVHLGVHPAYAEQADPGADAAASAMLGGDRSSTDLLHVGGTFGRKRLDLVLGIFAAVRAMRPEVRLIRVGGPLTDEQTRIARELGIQDAILSLPFVDREVLAAVYRRAALVILPSDEEGFGFPVLEAMACGTPVIASDLPVLREVGGDAARYEAVADIEGWTASVLELLADWDRNGPGWEVRRRRGVAHAARFTWAEYARKMANVYREQLSR